MHVRIGDIIIVGVLIASLGFSAAFAEDLFEPGPLAQRYEQLVEANRVDTTRAGTLVTAGTEKDIMTILAKGKVANEAMEMEVYADPSGLIHIVVRYPAADGGAEWYFVHVEDGRGTILFLGLELPAEAS